MGPWALYMYMSRLKSARSFNSAGLLHKPILLGLSDSDSVIHDVLTVRGVQISDLEHFRKIKFVCSSDTDIHKL